MWNIYCPSYSHQLFLINFENHFTDMLTTKRGTSKNCINSKQLLYLNYHKNIPYKDPYRADKVCFNSLFTSCHFIFDKNKMLQQNIFKFYVLTQT
jgi:hypothetical protein